MSLDYGVLFLMYKSKHHLSIFLSYTHILFRVYTIMFKISKIYVQQ